MQLSFKLNVIAINCYTYLLTKIIDAMILAFFDLKLPSNTKKCRQSFQEHFGTQGVQTGAATNNKQEHNSIDDSHDEKVITTLVSK